MSLFLVSCQSSREKELIRGNRICADFDRGKIDAQTALKKIFGNALSDSGLSKEFEIQTTCVGYGFTGVEGGTFDRLLQEMEQDVNEMEQDFNQFDFEMNKLQNDLDDSFDEFLNY
tara:strand:- start:37 stop:384 length:348 start_codon:yes stop_codon:yes gene_type:complete